MSTPESVRFEINVTYFYKGAYLSMNSTQLDTVVLQYQQLVCNVIHNSHCQAADDDSRIMKSCKAESVMSNIRLPPHWDMDARSVNQDECHIMVVELMRISSKLSAVT